MRLLMEIDTAGNKIEKPIICCCCRQDTAGNHEWTCPNYKNKITQEVDGVRKEGTMKKERKLCPICKYEFTKIVYTKLYVVWVCEKCGNTIKVPKGV